MANKIILVDTDVIINHVKTDSNFLDKYFNLAKKKDIRLKISVITIFEYFTGIDPKEKDLYEQSSALLRLFEVENVNSSITKIAAKLNYEKKLYQHIHLADLLIGATALYLDAPLLTFNKKHFRIIPQLKFA